ncbi:thiopurine S-methyltransferase [Hoeflea poritis]|uniref:Thiopurine S-methyltransferase n=1 Tax=Hoeflea poritis TaxID=2993659 RepID=A0ABT4VS93_9HYPH|nr:thiopurine S-methyltransferase [Hoeflea poritis]MDA4847576.1 thiopurine S-methyltransferase [Hoeflea poritis]
MDEEFWQIRWRENRIGFHEGRPHEQLVDHVESLGLSEGDTVFVPLCGKSLDLDWLLSRNLRVVGAEFNRQAVEEVFARQSLVPEIRDAGSLIRFSADALDIFVGDVFALTAAMLGAVDAVYDRAALVALPPETRPGYASHLSGITGQAKQLLIGLDYDQAQMNGPPFSVPEEEIRRLYESGYGAELISRRPISGPLARRCSGTEEAWLLIPKPAS